MDLKAFGMNQLDQLQQEAKEKWGDTSAFKEFEKRKSGMEEVLGGQLMNLFAEMGTMKSLSPEDQAPQAMVRKIQEYISEHFYQCPNGILKTLGEMYVSDERFKKAIDKVGGSGTAEFAKKAIDAYCRK